MAHWVYINGEVVPGADARISVYDRGFLYGDGVYEVFRTYGGRAFALPEHLARLQRSGALLAIDHFPSNQALEAAIDQLLGAVDHGDSYVRLMVTRGEGPIALDPAMADQPRLVILAKEVAVPPPEHYQLGIDVVVVSIVRNPRGALDPSAKSGNYLNNILALREARQQGAHEAVMLNVDGNVSEGASSNIFVVQQGALYTPPLRAGILEGITRQIVLRLAEAEGLQVEEVDLKPDALREADEAFITSSIRELLPIRSCDGHPLGEAKPGPITRRLHALYRQEVERLCGAKAP